MVPTELTIKNLDPKSKIRRVTDGGGLTLEILLSDSKLWCWRYHFQVKSPLANTLLLALPKHESAAMHHAPWWMLDGGHLAFYCVEALRGRLVTARFQEYRFRPWLFPHHTPNGTDAVQ